MTIDKIVRIGTLPGYTRESTFCRIQFDGKCLSITGVEGPSRGGNCVGSCGQIGDHIEVGTYAPGWDEATLARFVDVWRNWHLNDMRAGCEHQRAAGWHTRPIDPEKPLDAYGQHLLPKSTSYTWNMLAWVNRSEHPEGLLGEPCPVCGYRYGTSWLHEDVPAEVIEFLNSLPATDVVPAWV